MTAADALRGVSRIFLDTAPVIYFVERAPLHFARVGPVFDLIDAGSVAAVTSPITLAECLVVPCRLGLVGLERDFTDLIVLGGNTTFAPLDEAAARGAAGLRARYNLSLPDAFQVAVAIEAGCEVFLTNDAALKRVVELRVLITDDLDP